MFFLQHTTHGVIYVNSVLYYSKNILDTICGTAPSCVDICMSVCLYMSINRPNRHTTGRSGLSKFTVVVKDVRLSVHIPLHLRTEKYTDNNRQDLIQEHTMIYLSKWMPTDLHYLSFLVL